METMVYEVLNVAHEVIFEGSAPECLKYCVENDQKASFVREKNDKGGQSLLSVSLWMLFPPDEVYLEVVKKLRELEDPMTYLELQKKIKRPV